MRDKELEMAKYLRKAVATKKKSPSNRRVLVGLDGFIDEIVHVVDTREDHKNYRRMAEMKDFAGRIASFAGKSGNIEFVTKRIKIGGNGPIMANAMAELGAFVTYIGNLGYPNVNQVFRELEQKADIITLAETCHTDAVEFEDGKIMIGKMDTLDQVNWDRIIKVAGREKITDLLDASHLLALVNWTMLPHMSDIWEKIIEEICPNIFPDQRRYVFFDLADPQKRTVEDKKRMLDLVSRFSKYYRVIFGLNGRESFQIAEVLGVDVDRDADGAYETVCAAISEKLGIYSTVVHPVEFAVTTVEGVTYKQEGPHTSHPVITTGAGDHFNAAFTLGMTLDMPPQTCLFMGVCNSGYYVMTGKTPGISELIEFMETWRDDPFGKLS
ncbi:MAG TPA: hypothetical protein PLN69_08475 [bacterium]|nr:hypothetical protein [bacterium]